MLSPAGERIDSNEILAHKWLNCKKRKFSNEIFQIDEKILKKFALSNKLKKAVLIFIVSQLSEEELEPYRSLFLNLDIHNRGSIGFNEFLQILPENYQKNEEKSKKLFNCLDLNKNGTIEYIEFLAACLENKRYLTENRLKDAFNIFDLNKSGFFGIEEIKTVIGRHVYYKKHKEDYWEKCVKEIVGENNKEISFKDFLIMMN